MNIVISNDHAAIELKQRIVHHLRNLGHTVTDKGVTTPDSVDYPDMAKTACEEYLGGGYDFGVLCCGTGIGISISANKIAGIRCALLCNSYSATMARLHNDANFIAFGGRIEYQEPVENIINAFLAGSFEGGRHQRRVDKINALDHDSA
jgi:ribose 5-phosphate isomerase B